MPANDAELQQLKAYVTAMVQLIQAIEARNKVETEPALDVGTPPARMSRLA
jgi:hypothetical protein